MVMMNLIDSVCKFIENAHDKSESEQNKKIEIQPEQSEKEKSSYKLNPRDGMSLESAIRRRPGIRPSRSTPGRRRAVLNAGSPGTPPQQTEQQ